MMLSTSFKWITGLVTLSAAIYFIDFNNVSTPTDKPLDTKSIQAPSPSELSSHVDVVETYTDDNSQTTTSPKSEDILEMMYQQKLKRLASANKFIDIDNHEVTETFDDSEKVTNIGEYIDLDSHEVTEVFDGTEKVTNVGAYIDLDSHEVKESFDGSEKVTNVGEYIDLDSHEVTEKFDGSEKVTSVGEYIDLDREN